MFFKTNAEVTREGFAGDHQADRRLHGEPEKALHYFAGQCYKIIVSAFPELPGIAVPGNIGEDVSC